jgi:FkbM family methyltransferase
MGLNTTPVWHISSALKKALPQRYRRPISGVVDRIRGYRLESYSQFGEDLTLKWLFEGVSDGFYVDVGAYHPKKFSNTYYFYRRGWSGINIDPTPGVVEQFRKARPRDINLPYAVASNPCDFKLYINESERGVNTLSPEFADRQRTRWGRRYSSEIVVRARTLEEILRAHMPDSRPIQFLSVDVEGLDLEVLKSNDWEKYTPNVILCEDLALPDIECRSGSDTWAFLHERGYVLVGKCVHTLVFAHRTFKTAD